MNKSRPSLHGTILCLITILSILVVVSPASFVQAETYSYTTQWGSYGSENGQFTFPEVVAVDSSGYVYVTDKSSCRVQKFNGDGTYLGQFGSSGSEDGQFSEPFGIVVYSGSIYVVDTNNFRVEKFSIVDPATPSPSPVPTATPTPTPSVSYITQWSSNCGKTSYQPYGITVDNSGNVYVYQMDDNDGASILEKYTNTGTYLGQIGSGGSENGQYMQSLDIAADSVGNVYVLDYVNCCVEKYSSQGTFITQWSVVQGTDANYIAVDNSGNVYVTDKLNDNVRKYTNTGTLITKWGTYGKGNGQLSSPRGIAVDSTGNVYVVDTFNNRIQKFSSDGTYLMQWGSKGTGNGQFNMPMDIAVDSTGKVYVTDYVNNRVQIFTSNGGYITQFGSKGSGDGQFLYPFSVAVDSYGNIYVVDFNNRRVEKFALTTTVQASTGSSTAVNLKISGTIVASQMSNLKLTTSRSTTAISFTVTGQSGTSGFGNVTIPKSAVASGTTPKIYIDGQLAAIQGYTQDTNNYYVWYSTNFSEHAVTIEFASDTASTQSGLDTNLVIAFAAIILVVLVVGLFLKRRSRLITKNWIKH